MKRVKLTYRGREILSEGFSFKAYRVMHAAFEGGLDASALDAASVQGLIALFDGTELTEDVFINGWQELDGEELDAAMGKVWSWYAGVKAPAGGGAAEVADGNPVIGLYRALLDSYGTLPDEIDRQDPQLLLDVLCAEKTAAFDAAGVPDDVREYYGL